MDNTGNKNKMLIIAAGVAIIGGLVVYLGYSYLGNEKANNDNNQDSGVVNEIMKTVSNLTSPETIVNDIDGNEGLLKSQVEGTLMKNLLKQMFNQEPTTTSP